MWDGGWRVAEEEQPLDRAQGRPAQEADGAGDVVCVCREGGGVEGV